MLKSLNTLIQTGNLLVNSDGSLGYVGYNGFDRNNNSNGYVDVKKQKGDNGHGDTFIFNSPKPIDEIEASRQMKKTKQERKLQEKEQKNAWHPMMQMWM